MYVVYEESLVNFRITTLLLSVLLTVISLPFGLVPSPVYATNISVDPATGTVGTRIAVTGSGFVGRLATIYWDDKKLIQNIPVSKEGQISYVVEAPSSAKGLHIVKVTDDSNWENVNASVSFAITPSITAEPPWGRSPNLITLFGSGFVPNETGIFTTWEGQKLSKSPVNADKNGAWHSNFDVPGLGRGEYAIGAYGDSTRAIEVPPLMFTIGPFCKATPLSGPVGTEIMISGVGFRPGEDGVTFTWDGPIIDTNFVAEPNGTFSYPIIVPPSTRGKHTIGIYGSSFTPKGIVPDIEFEVTPSIKLTPSIIENSKDVRIDGAGFNAQEQIAVTYDKINVNVNATTDDRGSFNLTFQTPYSPGKDHTVIATGNKGASAPATHTLTVLIPPTPDLRYPGPGASIQSNDSVMDVLARMFSFVTGLFSKQAGGAKGMGDTTAVTLNWAVNADQTGLTYSLQISSSQDFMNVVFNRDKIPFTTYDLTKSSLPGGGTYFWRVRAVNDSGEASPWSNIWSFQLQPGSLLSVAMAFTIVILLLGMIVFGIMALISRSRSE